MKPEGKFPTLEMTLRRKAKDLGIDLFGVADLKAAENFIVDQGGDYLKIFPRAISLGSRLLDPIVNELYRHDDRAAIFTYRSHYNAINTRLDQASLSLSKKIQEKGYRAYPVPASQQINAEKLAGVFSHKLAAHLAGLGWIGKSCLLITPEYGPRVRFATIMTDAPLDTGSVIPNRCGQCAECVKTCPVKAFTGIPFSPLEPREKRFTATLCKDYTDKRTQRLGEGLCGLCVYVCPFGARERAVHTTLEST